MARDGTRDGLHPLHGSAHADLYVAIRAEPAASRRVVELDSSGANLDQAARLERPRELLEGRTAGVTEEDRRERLALRDVRRVVEIEEEVPRGSRLVVVVPGDEHHPLAGQVDLAGVASLDR